MRMLSQLEILLLYILVVQWILVPVPLRAQFSSSKVFQNDPNSLEFDARRLSNFDETASEGKLKVVVLGLNDGTVKSSAVQKVTDTLRDELIDRHRFWVFDKAATGSFFSENPQWRTGINFSNPLTRYIQEAQDFYLSSHFKEAIGVLSNTIATYRRSQPAMVQRFPLVEAYLALGNIYLGYNDKKNAKQALKEAVRLDPTREISDAHFPPNTVAKFVQAKEELLRKAKSAKLDILTQPKKAEVYLNGVFLGLSPVKMERLMQGQHYLLIKKAGYQAKAQKITLKHHYQRLKLELSKDLQAASASQGEVQVKDLRDVEAQVRLASKIGNLLKAQKVILVSLQEVGYNYKITSRMIDMNYYASHKPKSVEVLNLPKDTRSAAQVLAKYLIMQADLDLGKNPKKYADSEVIVIGKKKKRPLFKNPIFWGILGALVVGGTVGSMVLLRNQGGGNNHGDPQDTTTSVNVMGVSLR